MLMRLSILLFMIAAAERLTAAPDPTATALPAASGSPELCLPAENLPSSCLQPVKTAPAPMTVIFSGLIRQSLRQTRRRQCVRCYEVQHVTSHHHPINSYKLSLSANTADG